METTPAKSEPPQAPPNPADAKPPDIAKASVPDTLATLKVNPTGTLDKWETQSCRVKGAKGVQDLYLKFTGGQGPLLNFDWWKFE